MDRLLSTFDQALRTLFARPAGSRANPAVAETQQTPLSDSDKRKAGALMRVNHVGEVCAQALYSAQALATRDPVLRAHHEAAAREEVDHLAWTRTRLDQLDARASLLNPVWYAGAFGLGLLAGRLGDPVSLGFVVETERQVEHHLAGHLERLPAADMASRAVLEQMMSDEARHAAQAQAAGAAKLPRPVRQLMRAAAKVMTTTAYYV